MKLHLLLAAALLASPALADSDRFGGRIGSGSFSASGFVNAPQGGSWQVGAMNESYGFAGVREASSGVEISTSGGSTSEGFGNNFRGLTGAVGFGGGRGFSGFGGRF